MSGIGALVAWDGTPSVPSLIERMMRPIAHRGPDGVRCETRGQVALGHAWLALEPPRGRAEGLAWLPDGTGVTADARLYDRHDLACELGLGLEAAAVSDAELILAAYQRWGSELCTHLDGDYAFVLWDAQRRGVLAARDPFGVKPLFYHVAPGRLLFGSEPKQLLAGGAPLRVHDRLVVEYLRFQFAATDETFFAAIHRLAPAEQLWADAGGLHKRRHWIPDPDRALHLPRREDYAARLRELLSEALRKRLQLAAPAAVELSGGLDSGSLVALGAELGRRGEIPGPVVTLSAVFPGLECDESDRIAAMTRLCGWPGHRVFPLAEPLTAGLREELAALDSPLAEVQRGWDAVRSRTLGPLGVRVVLGGLGGDDLLDEDELLPDLVAERRYGQLARELWLARAAGASALGAHGLAMLRAAAPASLRRLARAMRPREPHVPAWLRPEAARAFVAPAPACADWVERYPTRTQRTIAANSCHPMSVWLLETLEARAARAGFELRHPFFDRALVEFLLAIPLGRREHGGMRKRLLRQAMQGLVPDHVRLPRHKVLLDSWGRTVLERHRAELARLLAAGDHWCSGAYVERSAGEALIRSGPAHGLYPECWRVATLELWLRGLAC
jgi:asparagine synthase (glutamine-hydrolysing)